MAFDVGRENDPLDDFMNDDPHQRPLPWLALSLFLTFSIVAAAAGTRAALLASPGPKYHEFTVQKSSIHFCQDQVEAERRYQLTKQASTADVYRLGGTPASQSLTPILKCAVIRTIGGGTDAEPSTFGVEVTEDQRKAIEEALATNQLFIIYYHYGW